MAAPPPMPGYVTPMPPQLSAQMPIGLKHPSDSQMDDEPANKKMRNEDSLVPEPIFLARNAVSLLLVIS